MFCFLETDIKEQKKYKMRTQTSVDNTVNDLRYETKIYFILGDVFFKIPENSWHFFCGGRY